MGWKFWAVALACAATLGAAAAAAAPARAQTGWTPYERPAQHTTIHERDVRITTSDGTVLAADVIRPQAEGRFPVLLQQTPYDRRSPTSFGDLPYLAERGYVTVLVDVRGTGGSGGTWHPLDEREQRYGYELTNWAAQQPWSDGNVGLFGASYMGLNQLLTAAQRPQVLKAIFPIAPMADGYLYLAFSGAQPNTSAIPLWLGLVTGGAIVPIRDALGGDPGALARGLQTLLGHAGGTVNAQAGALLGGDAAFDGPFWDARSPLEIVGRISVPAFVVGGRHDLFQRGAPLIYERLKNQVDARLLVGPWTHPQTVAGEGLPAKGLPATLSQLQLRWFDQHLKGIDTGLAAAPKVTQWVAGASRFAPQQDWPEPRLQPQRLYLAAGRALTSTRPRAAEPADPLVQQPVSGICTQGTDPWTAGLGTPIPCTRDGRGPDPAGVTYTTTPLERDLQLDGPIVANLHVRSTSADAVLTVRALDVARSGRATELTSGWLAASLREVDDTRSRVVRGKLLQPWHPFTRASAKPLTPGESAHIAVEVFPTRAVIRKGHRLRIMVTPGDFPHAIPPLPELRQGLGGTVEILHDPEHPSNVLLPRIGSRCPGQSRTKARSGKRCKRLDVPDLVREG